MIGGQNVFNPAAALNAFAQLGKVWQSKAMQVSSKVTAVFKHTPIVDYLATRFTYRSAANWLALVMEERVMCNGRICQPGTRVSQGDFVTCHLPDVPPPPANFAYSIVYEDAWLLGINKPANLRVHDKGKFVTANLMYHLRTQHQPAYPMAQLVNRLDKDTSGVVVVAKETAVVPLLAQQFQEQTVAKSYLAVVSGQPEPASGVMNWPIGPVPGAKVPRHGIDVPGAKAARTDYEVIRPFTHHALVQLRPKSGRTHQLRVHLAALGHPIVGDALYALNDDDFLAWCQQKTPTAAMCGLSRQALHCHETRFIHPITSDPITITAPLPADMSQLLAELEHGERP